MTSQPWWCDVELAECPRTGKSLTAMSPVQRIWHLAVQGKRDRCPPGTDRAEAMGFWSLAVQMAHHLWERGELPRGEYNSIVHYVIATVQPSWDPETEETEETEDGEKNAE